LGKLLCLFLSFKLLLLLVFFCCLLICLYLSKLFEHVLVVEKGMGKFLLEDISLQETSNSILENWLLKKLVDIWSRVGVFIKHHAYQVGYLGRVVARQRSVFPLADSNRQLMQG